MNESSSDIDVLLERARRGLGPTAGDAARLRLALTAAIPAGETPGSAEGDAPESDRLDAGSRESLGAAAPLGRLASGAHVAPLVKLGAAVALAAATGAGGYVLGYRTAAAEHERRPAPVSAQARPSVERAPHAPPLGEPAASSDARAAEPIRALPTGREPGRSARAWEPAAPAAESPLDHETRLLTRVERALRNDNPLLALGLLGELDRDVPGGQLVEERQAARVLAQCALRSESAPKLAADFLSRHTGSAYRSRIEQVCGARASSQGE